MVVPHATVDDQPCYSRWLYHMPRRVVRYDVKCRRERKKGSWTQLLWGGCIVVVLSSQSWTQPAMDNLMRGLGVEVWKPMDTCMCAHVCLSVHLSNNLSIHLHTHTHTHTHTHFSKICTCLLILFPFFLSSFLPTLFPSPVYLPPSPFCIPSRQPILT